MPDRPRWFQTTAIDYPNSRPHIGTAFEKLGADVQARYRRMEGYDVFFLMGNDENTVKVSRRAAELKLDTQAYCDDMARQFQEVWRALNVRFDAFVQTSSPRHHACCRKFIQKVYDNGHIYKGSYEGLYCDGCEAFKGSRDLTEAGECPQHPGRKVPTRTEPCYFFRLSAFQERLVEHLRAHPEFIQPESRRNEILSLIENEGLHDVNITRTGESWGIRLPWDPEFTVYVWFDALLTYITGIGYGDDPEQFARYWPADTHFIGKDITRFHTALWPAMLWAAGEEAPRHVFAHGWITVDGSKMGKSLGNTRDPLEIIGKCSVDAYRYFFLRDCPFPGDGDYSSARFEEVYNSELANNLGNLFSREMNLVWKNYRGVLPGTAGRTPEPVVTGLDLPAFVQEVRGHVEGNRFHLALQAIIQQFLTPTNQYLEANAPWKLVKTDLAAAQRVLFNAVESLRIASILLKPFIPASAERIYTSFNFAPDWDQVRYADAAALRAPAEDLRVTATIPGEKIEPLFMRLG